MPAGPTKAAGLSRNRRNSGMDLATLTYMANQIARNLAAQGDASAAAQACQHIRDYWDPRMKSAILAGDRAGLDPIARAAVEQLAG